MAMNSLAPLEGVGPIRCSRTMKWGLKVRAEGHTDRMESAQASVTVERYRISPSDAAQQERKKALSW